MLEVLLGDENSALEPAPSQFAHYVPGVEYSLSARFYWVRKLAVIAFQIEPLQALKLSQKSDLDSWGNRLYANDVDSNSSEEAPGGGCAARSSRCILRVIHV